MIPSKEVQNMKSMRPRITVEDLVIAAINGEAQVINGKDSEARYTAQGLLELTVDVLKKLQANGNLTEAVNEVLVGQMQSFMRTMDRPYFFNNRHFDAVKRISSIALFAIQQRVKENSRWTKEFEITISNLEEKI